MFQKIFDKDLIAIGKLKVTLRLNKATYVGMCILFLRKVLMYEFHYDYIKNKYDGKLKLLFTVYGTVKQWKTWERELM